MEEAMRVLERELRREWKEAAAARTSTPCKRSSMTDGAAMKEEGNDRGGESRRIRESESGGRKGTPRNGICQVLGRGHIKEI